jgi:predicted MFS family arabinose efflux permease
VIQAYRPLFAAPRARVLTGSALLGRLATGAYPIPLVLLIQESTRSFALAGAAQALNLTVSGIFVPIWGRAIDRLGSKVVIPRLSLVRGVLFAAMWPVAHAGAGWAMLVLATASGIVVPVFPTAMRLQWQQMLGHGDPRLEQAYALEASVQAGVFVIGPLLAGAGIATIGAGPSLVACAALIVAGGFLYGFFAFDDRTEKPEKERGRRLSVLRSPGVLVLTLNALLAAGAVGVIRIAVIAFSKKQGSPGAAGVLFAIFALAALVGAAFYGARAWQTPARQRLAVLMAAEAVFTAPLAFARSIGTMAALMIPAGAPLSAESSATYLALDPVAPAGATAEAYSWVSAGNTAGAGIGYAVAGALVTPLGTAAVFGVAASLLLVATAVVVLGQSALKSEEKRDPGG